MTLKFASLVLTTLIFPVASKSLTLYFVPDIVLEASGAVLSQKPHPYPQAMHSLVVEKDGK